MILYLDESGDLGWKFDAPYNSGGSSRYLTIFYTLLPSNKKHLIKREVAKTYKKFKFVPSIEYKGNRLTHRQRSFFLDNVVKLVSANNDIKLGAVTVKKDKVFDYIREDSNKLYNYLIKLGIVGQIKNCDGVIDFVRDERTVKVKSGNSLADYLQTVLWFEEGSRAIIRDIPSDSKGNVKLIFVDWLCNTVWSYYEFNDHRGFDLIKDHLDNKTFLI